MAIKYKYHVVSLNRLQGDTAVRETINDLCFTGDYEFVSVTHTPPAVIEHFIQENPGQMTSVKETYEGECMVIVRRLEEVPEPPPEP